MNSAPLYIGVLSGTSCDGIDVALVECHNDRPVLLDFTTGAFTNGVHALALKCIQGEAISAADVTRLDGLIPVEYSRIIKQLLDKNNLKYEDVHAIGMHGQTVHHAPDDVPGNTWQIGSPAHLNALTGVPVVSHFRQADMALGGQGAPLAPALHRQLFFKQGAPLAVVNLGGIANVTWLQDEGFLGFDTGPANALMDLWIQRHQNAPYDAGGQWAAAHAYDAPLLTEMLSDPYFDKAAPKSTGREYFSAAWLDAFERVSELPAGVVQSTLAQLTARTVAAAIEHSAAQSVLLCGGGAHNTHIQALLSAQCGLPVQTTAAHGLSPDAVESVLFAWLAQRFAAGVATDLRAVTGCSQALVYGELSDCFRVLRRSERHNDDGDVV